MTGNYSGNHLTACMCTGCNAESMTSNNTGSAPLQLTAEDLKMPSSAASYIKALYGSNSAIWDTNGGSTVFGESVSLNYSYDAASWSNPFGYSSGAVFDAAQEAAAEAAMDMWAGIANITFTETAATTANIVFMEYDLPSGVAGQAAKWAGTDAIGQVEVTVDTSTAGYTAGGWGWVTMIHEIGHALGLKHPGNYNAGGGGTAGPYLTAATDNRDLSIMSYNAGTYTNATNPTTPMIYDIAAMQYFYGANHSYNAGNTTYTLTNTANVHTRWDGAGIDTLDTSSYAGGATIDLREGISNITHVGNNHSWNAFGADIENAKAGAGNDTIYGSDLDNVMEGGNGTDLYVISGTSDGADTIIDADGLGSISFGGKTLSGTAAKLSDTAYLLTVGTTKFNLAISGADIIITPTKGTGSITVKNFTSGDLGITLGTGTVLAGTAGNDKLTGTIGVDSIDGGAGNDTIKALTGKDTINGGDGNDNITADGNDSEVNGEGGNDTITSKGTNVTLSGGDGNDKITASLKTGNATVSGGAGNDTITTAGTASVDGGLGDDKITASGTSTISGGDGNDTITSKGAASTINGGLGDDKITSSGAGDTVNGGDGNDTISAKGAASVINGGAGNDKITSGGVGNTVNGGDGNDTITGSKQGVYYGDAGNDSIKAGAGNDTIDGGTGADTLYGGADNDSITGGDDADILYGEKANDTLIGGAGADTLYGGDGNDSMNGGTEDDVLIGGKGNDTMTGGAGADIFRFNKSEGVDIITDFVNGTDKIGMMTGTTSTTILNAALASATQVGSDTVLIFNGTTITLQNFTLGNLDASDFI